MMDIFAKTQYFLITLNNEILYPTGKSAQYSQLFKVKGSQIGIYQESGLSMLQIGLDIVVPLPNIASIVRVNENFTAPDMTEDL